MKRTIALLLAVLALVGCGKKVSLKVEDPARRAEMRTRDAACPVDSVLTSKGLKTTLNIVDQFRPKALAADFKAAGKASAEEKQLARMKDAYATVKKDHADDYSADLTLYMSLMIIAFVVIVLFKTIRAIFKND